jgi:hypothetical protein
MLKRVPFLIALLLSWLVAAHAAWAGYDARAGELKNRLDTLKFVDDFTTLERAVNDYMKARNEGLDDLVHLIEDDSADKKQQSSWNDRVDRMRTEAQRVTDAGKSMRGGPSTLVINFLNTFGAEEGKFLEALKTMEVPKRRDFILENRKNVKEMTEKREIEWRALFDQDNAIDEHEKAIYDQVSDLIDRSFDQADKEQRTTKEQLVDGVQRLTRFAKDWGKPLIMGFSAVVGLPPDIKHAVDEALRVLKEAEKPISVFAKIYLKVNEDYLSRSSAYASEMRSERGGVYVLFGSLRASTEDFVRKNDYALAKQEYFNAESDLRNWRSVLYTSALQSDADSFGKDVLSKLSNHLHQTETVFNDFVGRHKGKFFGPIGPDIEESLTESRVWEDRVKAMDGKDLEGKLRQWRSEANTFFSVSMSGLTDSDQAELRKWIQPRVDELVKALEQAGTLSAQLHKDFDRRDLKNDLR